MLKLHRTYLLSLILLCFRVLCADEDGWRFIAGLVSEYNSYYFNTQPSNIPNVNNSNNVSYLTSTLTDYSALNIIDDLNYDDRKIHGSKISGGFSFGIEKNINESWLFRLKAMHVRKTDTILDVNTMLYTPDKSNSATVTVYNGSTSSSATYNNIFAQESIIVTQQPHNAYSMAILYKFSDRFHSGLVLTKQKQKYTLQLNDLTETTFKPSVTEVGIDTLYHISEYLSLNSTVYFGKKEKFITRDVNFQVTQATSDDEYTYTLSYVTPSSTSSWQSCNGYLIDGKSCTQSSTYNNTYISDYYVNDSIPTSYGTDIYVNTINSYEGPQVWWSRFFIRASLSLEWNIGVY